MKLLYLFLAKFYLDFAFVNKIHKIGTFKRFLNNLQKRFELFAKPEPRLVDLKNENNAKDRRIAALEAGMQHLIEEKEDLRKIVDQVRNQPFAVQCAW